MRLRVAVVALACLALPVLAAAQGAELKIPSFSHLQQQATEVVDVTIGSWPLAIVGALMKDDDPSDAEMKHVLKGLKRVVVRSYQFDSDFVYSHADVQAVRDQLAGPGWTQLAQVRSRKNNENVDVYVAMEHEQVAGFVVIASDPREFTILNVVGSIDLAHMAKLQEKLELPQIAALSGAAP